MRNEAYADPIFMDDEVRHSRVRAIAALTLLIVLGLLAAGSALARPFHPAVGQVEARTSERAAASPIDPKC